MRPCTLSTRLKDSINTDTEQKNVDNGMPSPTIKFMRNEATSMTPTSGVISPVTNSLPAELMNVPRHSHSKVNLVLEKTDYILRKLHKHSKSIHNYQHIQKAKEAGQLHETIYAQSYVDLGKIDVIGFDFDYTLVTYTDELLELIYEMVIHRLVTDRQYPLEIQSCNLQYDPFFSIRGLAVDKENGWITHLSYTHKVTAAWEGREKVPTSRIFEEYQAKRALRPSERRNRLKPLNDLFSMAECCLIADVIQFFKDRGIPYCPQNVVTDVLKAVTATHLSGDFHRLVAQDPERYFHPTPHLKQTLRNMKEAGKKMIFVSNSPFWYVDAGMRYVFGNEWRDEWDAIITSTFWCMLALGSARTPINYAKHFIVIFLIPQVRVSLIFTPMSIGPSEKFAKRRDDSCLNAWTTSSEARSMQKVVCASYNVWWGHDLS
jgi:FMN phosphatase YigB (HAD superfamily)